MSDAVLQAKIKAFDEFTNTFHKYQQELKNVDKTQREAAQGADKANKSTGDFFKTVAELGALYAFKRGLDEVIASGRDFELTIKQAQAVTGDFSATLRNLAMATRGGNLDTFGPTQLAEAYRELGAAGATTTDIMAATPHILEFGSAALLNMEQSAYGVLAAAKSFNIALTDSGQIVDAYTEAMNLGALAGEDFSKIMGSAGAVAKLAGQDFREILSVGSALRDAGVSADESGTAIKSALMQIINPSKEARDLMKELGINIYETSGNMKQWSEITAEFEKALGPYNEQSKQLILSTVFGSYGIRAMATSLNNGSDYLKAFTEGLKNADSATHEMAEAMSDTYDGAARQFNASLERTKILLFEDVAPAAGVVFGALNTLLLGVQSLDEGTRKFILILIGSTGLGMALAAVTTAVRTLLPLLAAFGIGTSALAGPIGLVIGLIGAATTAFVGYKGAVASAALEETSHIKTLEGQIRTIPNLVKQHEELSKKTNRTAEEEAALKQVTGELADIMPEAIRGFGEFGDVILDTGNLAETAKGKIASLKDEVIGYYKLRADMAREQLPDIKRKYKDVEEELKPLQEQLKIAQSGKYDIKIAGTTIPMGWAWGKDLGDPDTIKSKIKATRTEQEKLYSDRLQFERDLAIYESIKKGTYWDKPASESKTDTQTETKTWTPPTGGEKGKNLALDAAQAFTEAVNTALLPYRNAVEMAGIAVGSLTSKEQFLTQIISSGNGTIADSVALNKTRVEQYVRLTDQQEALHKQANAERIALANLEDKLKSANDPKVVKELQSEMLNLQKSIAQAGQSWMQAEQQKIMMLNRVKEEEKKRYTDAYQKAMDLMRHQVSMAAMSTEQQIRYLEKLRDAHEWTQQQMWELEESLYRLRRQQLTDMLDEVEDEYTSRLDAIDARTKAITQSIQSQIDELNKKSQDNSRTDAQIKYNQKIQELIEKRHYHEKRTGKEHTQAILDIDKELAEEQHQWELQQQEWAIEDQKSNLQKQLDQAKEEGDRERKQAEEHYRKAKRIAESGVMDIIAALAATEPKWMETGRQLIDALISGMKSGDFSSVQRLVDKVRDSSPTKITDPDITDDPSDSDDDSSEDDIPEEQPLWTIPSGAYKRYGDTTAMRSRDLAELLGESVTWDQSRGQVKIGGKAFSPLDNQSGTTYVSIRQVAEAFGYRVVWDDPDVEIYRAAKGGIFTRPALSMMAEAGGSEVALPLDRLQPMIDVAVLRALNQYRGEGETTIIEHQYNAPLFNSEKTVIDDDTRSEVVARDIVGLQKSAMRGRGY